MRIDEGRADQPVGRIDRFPRFACNIGLDRGDLATGDGDIDALAAIRQVCVLDDEIEHKRLLELNRQRSPRR
ncbi:hypothetical protein D3C71_2004990 [compost metagenome]